MVVRVSLVRPCMVVVLALVLPLVLALSLPEASFAAKAGGDVSSAPAARAQGRKAAAKPAAGRKAKAANAKGASQQAGKARGNVYANQPPVSEKELLAFLDMLPRFREWSRQKHESARPAVRAGKADFAYSAAVEQWVREQKWDPRRFFCVMGRMAAALAIVEEGNDMRDSRPKDMPEVTQAELALARKHLGSLLKAGEDAPPLNN